MIDLLEQTRTVLPRLGWEERIATTTLLPSGATGTVRLRQEEAGCFTVSDEGCGLEEAALLGLSTDGHDVRRAREIASRTGLSFDGERFFVRDLSDEQVAAGIAYVADAAREWAAFIVGRPRGRTEAGISDLVQKRLRALLPNNKLRRNEKLIGDSTRQYEFDFVLDLTGDRRAIFEIVNPEPASLQSAHLKLYDLKMAHPEWPREVVTERLDAWDTPDMVLLAGVSTHVRDFQNDWADLAGLAA